MVAAAAALDSPPSSWIASAWAALRPPPKLSLSEWANKNYVLSRESSAQPGRYRARSYQKGILDAITDPTVKRISLMKSARIGYTVGIIGPAIGYFMDCDPCPIMEVQPTVDTAKKYSKEFIAPMLRDVPVLVGLVKGASVKTSGNTVLDKSFPGGVISIIGANSGAGFRMSSRRVVIFDEVDAYPPSAGDEGDPIALGEMRSQEFWNRKIIAGSTPLVAGASRIEELFESGDRRRFYVPCPECGHMDVLRFRKRKGDEREGGHRMRWPDDMPDEACFECSANGCVIEEQHKSAMLEAGEWRAEGEFNGHASFHIWAAYSMSPNATWGQIATEFVAASKAGPEKLRTVVNTILGETWQERGEAPEWERLYQRREPYPIGTVPDGVIVVTCGVDVQKDRFVYEVVGWGANKESWSLAYGELHGDTALDATWLQLDILLDGGWQARDVTPGASIAMLAIDSGAFTQAVYEWARWHPMSRVIAVKGDDGPRPIIGPASPVEINFRGKRIQRGYKVWPVGVDTAKGELYGWLRMPRGEGDPPPGWCHFPEHDPEYFKQLTSEHLITVVNKRTHRSSRRWDPLPNRENHALDCRIYARAAAAVLGIDRLPAATRPSSPAPPATVQPATVPAQPPPERQAPRRPSWGGGLRAKPGGWLGRWRR